MRSVLVVLALSMVRPAFGKVSSDRPCLRQGLEAFPVKEGKAVLALRDPAEYTDKVARMPAAAAAVLELCDCSRTREEVRKEFLIRNGSPLPREVLDKLLAQLDQALLLDSPRFRALRDQMQADFAHATVRAPHLAGLSYPDNAKELRDQLRATFKLPDGPGAPRPGPLPKAIIVPHIDPERGAAAYAWAYAPLSAPMRLPDLIVIFGTDHVGTSPFTLTRKDFDTPLGRVHTDKELVNELSRRGGTDLLRDEFHHRNEHSIEFQMVWLRFVLGDRLDRIPVLPILVGSTPEGAHASGVSPVLNLLRELTAKRRVLWIAAGDLSHVGPRYGDDESYDGAGQSGAARDALDERNRASLRLAASGNAEAWWSDVEGEGESRRICGANPVYDMLRASQAAHGRVVYYAQRPDKNDSSVAIGTVLFP
jgi:AmmeMemoRadiSam system protein B